MLAARGEGVFRDGFRVDGVGRNPHAIAATLSQCVAPSTRREGKARQGKGRGHQPKQKAASAACAARSALVQSDRSTTIEIWRSDEPCEMQRMLTPAFAIALVSWSRSMPLTMWLFARGRASESVRMSSWKNE